MLFLTFKLWVLLKCQIVVYFVQTFKLWVLPFFQIVGTFNILYCGFFQTFKLWIISNFQIVSSFKLCQCWSGVYNLSWRNLFRWGWGWLHEWGFTHIKKLELTCSTLAWLFTQQAPRLVWPLGPNEDWPHQLFSTEVEH